MNTKSPKKFAWKISVEPKRNTAVQSAGKSGKCGGGKCSGGGKCRKEA